MKNWERYLSLHNIPKNIGIFGLPKLALCVVIPCYNEPDIINTINSLWQCDNPKQQIAIIVVVNASENAPKEVILQNKKTYTELVAFANESTHPYLKLIPLYFDGIVRKHAGVGYARKIGMDYAVWLFYTHKNKNGILVSLDADCQVSKNYFTSIITEYSTKNLGVATHYFEHPIDNQEQQKAIIEYELYLRFFKWAIFYCGFPYAIHTVGSSFSVTANVYVKQGGMNRRQGGEDFYFLHKVVPNENFAEIKSATVYPSARTSNRVPFGTGPAIQQIELMQKEHEVYSFESFAHLKMFFSGIENLYQAKDQEVNEYILQQPDAIKSFLLKEDFVKWIKEINGNVSSMDAFLKRFYLKFSAFKVVQFLNNSHQNYYVKQAVTKEAQLLLEALQCAEIPHSTYDLLMLYRKIDKGTIELKG